MIFNLIMNRYLGISSDIRKYSIVYDYLASWLTIDEHCFHFMPFIRWNCARDNDGQQINKWINVFALENACHRYTGAHLKLHHKKCKQLLARKSKWMKLASSRMRQNMWKRARAQEHTTQIIQSAESGFAAWIFFFCNKHHTHDYTALDATISIPVISWVVIFFSFIAIKLNNSICA